MLLGALFASLTLAAAFLVALRRPWVGAALVVALLPWDGLAVDPGLRLTGYRLALFGWIGAMGVRAVIRRGRTLSSEPLGRLSLWGLAFFGYAAVWTLLQLVLVPGTDVTGAATRAVPQVRSGTQVAWLLLRFAPLLLLPAVLSRREEATALVRVFLVSLTVLAAVGWLQLGVWSATGVDVTPIGVVENLLGGDVGLRQGAFTAFGGRVLRMSSFGGEPKALGQSLAVGLLMLQGIVWLRSRGRRILLALWLFLFLAMLVTFSTSALYVWAGGTLVLAGYLLLTQSGGRARAAVYGFGLLGLCGLTLATGLAVVGVDPGAAVEVLEARTVGRRIVPDFDLAVLQFLRDQPAWGVVGVGLGNVHAYATAYLPEFALPYAEGEIFVAKSGYLRLLSEVGLIGLALFGVWMWREIALFRRSPLTARQVRGNAPEAAAFRTLAAGLGLVMVLAFLARGYLWNEAVWSVGMLRALRKGA